MSLPTPTELRATLITLVAGMTGTRCGPWEPLVGEVELLCQASAIGYTWEIAITGSDSERQTLEAAIALLQDEHPRIRQAPRRATAGAAAD